MGPEGYREEPVHEGAGYVCGSTRTRRVDAEGPDALVMD
jgi:hypothetical protein